MKPREKVVSAQDVQSSLYYCHLASEDDDALLQSKPQENLVPDPVVDSLRTSSMENSQAGDIDPARSRASHGSSILPPSTNFRMDKLSLHGEHLIRRKPIINQKSQDHHAASQQQTRKLLGPRPLVNRSAQLASSGPTSRVEPDPIRQSKATEQALPTPLAREGDIGLPTPSGRLHGQNNSILPESRYITLIRRDPATEAQWNIGNLSLSVSRSLQPQNMNAPRHNKDVLIKLSTTGYTRFADHSEHTDVGVFERELKLSAQFDTKNDSYSGTVPASTGHPSHSFLTPWQTACTFQTAATGRAIKCYHSLPESLVGTSARPKYGSGPQTALVSELRFNLPTLLDKSAAKKTENRRPMSFQQYNATKHESLGGIRSNSPNKSVDIAENEKGITTRKLLPSLQPPRTLNSMLHHRARSAQLTFGHRNLKDKMENSEDEADTQLDLLLGQERAGGGFNGNKAKLGKLIVYGGQGLAMLDLLVAANMALWFRDFLHK